LGLLYRNQQRYNEAEPLYLQSLAIRSDQLGKDHPETAIGLNNLAGLYSLQERYSEAESLYREALAIRELQFGTEHPLVGQSLNNLAILLDRHLQHCDEAEILYLRSLSIRKSVYGNNHSEVANSFYSLAGFYITQGRYSEAELYHLKAQEILMNCFGSQHPITVMVKQNFRDLIEKAVQDGQAGMLSDHSTTQQLLRSILA
jgi:tetratricopeptide (TPR) repeat protein